MGNRPARGRDREEGASLVEFALLAPFLLLILFGIIEFGWVFGQNLSVRHGAREGARLAAVAYGDHNTIMGEICNRTDFLRAVTVTFSTTDKTSPAGVGVGDEVTVEVIANTQTLTGFLDAFMPTTLSSEVSIRIEQAPSWTNGTYAYGPPC